MAERLKAAVLKTVERHAPGVRISLPPPKGRQEDPHAIPKTCGSFFVVWDAVNLAMAKFSYASQVSSWVKNSFHEYLSQSLNSQPRFVRVADLAPDLSCRIGSYCAGEVQV
jgi:hypothetical protein